MNNHAVVHVVDDDPAVRRAMCRLLHGNGVTVHEFGTAHEFLRKHDPDIPGCALLDLHLPDVNGLTLHRIMLDRGCHRPVIFMTGDGDVGACVCAMKAGAMDFLIKPFDESQLLQAVHEAMGRDRMVRDIANRVDVTKARLATLTPREQEVMGHVVNGRLNKQIASDLGIAEKTIKVHRARAMEKMGVRSLAQLVRQTVEFKHNCESSDSKAHG